MVDAVGAGAVAMGTVVKTEGDGSIALEFCVVHHECLVVVLMAIRYGFGCV